MKIGIFLSGRFPTEKAYGVTTTEVSRCLMKLGHEPLIFSVSQSNSVSMNLPNIARQFHYRENLVSRLFRRFSYRGFGAINVISWKFYWKIILILNKKRIAQHDFDLVWIRDIHMLSFVERPRNLIVEIHQKVDASKLRQMLLKVNSTNIILAPISKQILNEIDKLKDDFSIIYSPMGINSEKISKIDSILEYNSRVEHFRTDKSLQLKIGYVGKFFPDGTSKGVEDLLLLAKKNKFENRRLSISISGGTRLELRRLYQEMKDIGISVAEIEVNGHMLHDQAIEKMRNLDVIVLPKPSSAAYVGFPLKCLEALAMGRIVVVAKCQTYSDIFEDAFSPYWYIPGDVNSLYKVIESATSDPNRLKKIASGIDFVKRFTWEERVTRLLLQTK